MNGHATLMEMRQHGRRPRAVWFLDSDDQFAKKAAGDWHEQRNASDGAFHAYIRTEAADVPESLDLRALRGLMVHLSSDRGAARFHRLFEAVKEAGAACLVGVSDGRVFDYQQPQEIKA